MSADLFAELRAALPELRAHAESRMGAQKGGATVAVRRRTGQMTTAENGLEVPEWATIHADMPCRIGGANSGSAGYRTVDVGDGVEFQAAVRVVSFPTWIADREADPDLANGDLIEVTAGALNGRVYQIVEADPADQQTARRVPVIEAVRPEEWE